MDVALHAFYLIDSQFPPSHLTVGGLSKVQASSRGSWEEKEITHRENTVLGTELEVLAVVVSMQGLTQLDVGQILGSNSYFVT